MGNCCNNEPAVEENALTQAVKKREIATTIKEITVPTIETEENPQEQSARKTPSKA